MLYFQYLPGCVTDCGILSSLGDTFLSVGLRHVRSQEARLRELPPTSPKSMFGEGGWEARDKQRGYSSCLCFNVW